MSTSQLRFRRKIGDALYGEVSECELVPSASHQLNLPLLPLGKRRLVAVKWMSMSSANNLKNQYAANRVLDDPRQECAVADLLAKNGGHRNVVGSYFHFQKHQCLYLVNEFCADGDLYTHLSATTRNGLVDERRSIGIMKQILAGVDYLHRELGIAHRDLSLDNVLVHNGECKISDFGLSVDASARCVERVGKEYYMAPEIVAGGVYDPVKADIWSLGITWFILLTGSPLITVASKTESSFRAFQRFGVAAVFKSWGYEAKVSKSAIELISRMLVIDPSTRISLSEILAHPLFSEARSHDIDKL
uniref:Protein kinase domain-containing protein n=1 Tax=Phytophthora ramorum TaxID=164328 RepID=H3GYT3_PHYRM